MTRILSFALALAAFVGVFFLPVPDTVALAALEGQSILEGEVADPALLPAPEGALLELRAPTAAEAAAGVASVPLWQLVLRSPNYSEPAAGQAVLVLSHANMAREGLDLLDPEQGKFEDALVRGLRQKVEEARGCALEIRRPQDPSLSGASFLLHVSDEELRLVYRPTPPEVLSYTTDWRPASHSSLLPPLVAILLAVLLRRPVVSLFAGVLAGALLLRLGSPDNLVLEATKGLGDVFSVFFWNEFRDADRLKVIGFVVAMLGMVGVITKNGGIRGLMNIVARLARGPRSTQVATYCMGLAVFFDDYANTILVGSTMRPLTDRYRIAREKLAYIVDSTAAPVAGLSIFSTWIAFEVSTFSAQLPSAGMSPDQGYSVFIATLPYRFYCIFTLVLVALVTLSGRDFGPMLTAERRARRTGKVVRDGGTPMVSDVATAMEPASGIKISAWRALLPLAVFIGVTCFTILQTGNAFAADAPSLFSVSGLSTVLGDSDSYEALWRGSSLGLLVAVAASLLGGLRLEILDAIWKTLTSMGVALAILYLAWMIGSVCAQLHTAQYLSVMLGDIEYPLALPMILFVLSGAIAFSTGSSWSTMSILLPLVVGLAYTLGQRNIAQDPGGIDGTMLMVLSIGAVLEGSIFGDHCSPISDTTVLSSVASASDHIDHVRTQGPYAFLTMVVAIVAGYLPAAAFGLHPLLSILGGVLVLWIGLRVLGERVDEGLPEPGAIPPE
jgi:Na+/H+ antiporter NhaC